MKCRKNWEIGRERLGSQIVVIDRDICRGIN